MEQRNRIRDATRGDWRDLYAIQRQERRRFADAQRNAWSRMRFHIGTYRDDYRKAGKSGRKDMLKGAVSALISSKAERERLERKQKSERLYFADKLRRQAERLKRPIDERHKKDLAEACKAARRRTPQDENGAVQRKPGAGARDEGGPRQGAVQARAAREAEEELKENKRDLTQSNTPAKPPSLADRFAKAGRNSGKKPGENRRRAQASTIKVINTATRGRIQEECQRSHGAERARPRAQFISGKIP